MHPHHKQTPDRAKAAKRMYASGGRVHSDEAQDRKLIGKMIAEHDKAEGETKTPGKKSKARLDKRPRRADGGRVGKKGQTTVNIVIAGKDKGGDNAPMPVAAPMAAPPMPPPRPAMVPPPGAGMPPPMMRKDGGRIPHLNEATKRTEKMRAQMSNKKNFRAGGRVHSYPKMTAGAATGEGRLEKVEKYGKNARVK